MFKKLSGIILLTMALISQVQAQNTNTSTPQTRQRTSTRTSTTSTKTTTTQTPPAVRDEKPGTQETGAATESRTRRAQGNRQPSGSTDPTPRGVLAAFNTLLDGIRHADVDAVTGVYWESPQLVLFNNNGTVTRGWQQLRQNRASSYPNLKDVKLEVRDVRVQMLGRDGALLTCLWTQSQTYKGRPETASGRMTIVFRRVGNTWKAIHLHTSPDAPEPSRIPPSEQTTSPTPKPSTTP